ncbi:hypothetical protein HPB50_028578 [Hyalomma asiaticum]|nr:hypothetical protein HPB50_028578 [Hyalomma asiaticum]
MIGRAYIEGSKSDVAMNASPPQASYPCALRAVFQKTCTHSLKESFLSQIEKLQTAGYPEVEILRACHKMIRPPNLPEPSAEHPTDLNLGEAAPAAEPGCPADTRVQRELHVTSLPDTPPVPTAVLASVARGTAH